jgi:hypothetical protein
LNSTIAPGLLCLVTLRDFIQRVPDVRFGSKADILVLKCDVRFTPKADIAGRDEDVRFVPVAEMSASFDHFVGAAE